MTEKPVITKEQVEKDILKVQKKFQKEFKTEENLSRDYYVANGKYKATDINKYFSSFGKCIKSLFKKEVYNRDYFVIKKSLREVNKRYLITSIVAGQKVNEDLMKSIFTYCDKNDAELVLLIMRGVKKTDTFSEEVYNKYSTYFATEMTFNKNVKAMDFLLSPQQIISLTGLDRIARSNSVIVAHSKQQLQTIPNRITDYPHIMWSTGVCTYPNYTDDRIGKIAIQDHTMGGLILEIVDSEKFHIRNFQCDKTNGFCDLGFLYKDNKVSKIESDIVLGDIHAGAECKIALAQAKEIIKQLDCQNIYLNDLFDARSINHHEDKNMYAKYTRPIQQQSLQNELNHTGEFLNDFIKGIENRYFIVVPSNHDEFVNRWLSEGRFVFDSIKNALLGAELFTQYLNNVNPIKYYLESRKYLNKIKISFANRNDELISYGYTVHHGDKGSGGAKGSANSFDKFFDKNVSAHSHTPKRIRSSVVAGTNSLLDQPYIAGTASGWMHSDVIIYKNGTDQIINKIEGQWKL